MSLPLRPAHPRRTRVTAAVSVLVSPALAAFALLSNGCAKTPTLVVNQSPTITLTSGPVDTVSVPQTWIVDIAWTASDPDGSIDRFEYAIDPPTLKQAMAARAETSWVATRETRVTVRFRATQPDSVGPGATASDFHTFVLRAVDNVGGVSPRLVRAFYAYTVAPDVQITDPDPSPLLDVRAGMPFRITWLGHDPDGAGTTQPVEYRYRVFDFDLSGDGIPFLLDPDSLRRLALRTNWEGWQTVSGESTSVQIYRPDLVADCRAFVALVAVDEAGATTPYMLYDKNMLRFSVTFDAAPQIHLVSPLLDYRSDRGQAPGGVGFEMPSSHRHTLRWEGLPSPGRRVVFSRWMLDGDVSDPTPRSDEATDLVHWSQPQGGAGSATFGPLAAGEHRLYIELRDDAGWGRFFTVRVIAIAATLENELLVVNDTRFEVDKFLGDATRKRPDVYTRRWPSRTELDTFLFARGGFPWRGVRDTSAHPLSPPGLFAGFSFDTLGTRLGLEDPARALSLSRLARYRHVLWMVDLGAAQLNPTQSQLLFPITALRAMAAPGQPNSLGAYIAAGGQVWFAGGGAAFASLINFNVPFNDVGPTTVFETATGELGPGRVLYDAGHVRNAFSVTTAPTIPQRSPAAVGGWSGHGPDGTLSAPDYTKLPSELRARAPETDPMPPTRLPTQTNLYYVSNTANEYISAPNEILEDTDPDAEVVRLESTLDSLYEVSNVPSASERAIVMFYYHGRDNAPFVFTGLPLWDYTRADCAALVEFVLQDIWGLARSGPSVRPGVATSAPSRRAAPVRATSVMPR